MTARGLLSGSSAALRREEPTRSGFGDPALGGGERDSAAVGHSGGRVRVAPPGKFAVLEGGEFLEVRGLLWVAKGFQ